MSMNPDEMGRIREVELREIWKREAADFTPWLARNLERIGETLGMALELKGTEVSVGPYWADIVAQDANFGTTVVIENQMDDSDHRHLGQILTYGAGLNAGVVVWISPRFSPEHSEALAWLNAATRGRIQVFGVEIALWRIGESSVAPRFRVVEPRGWSPEAVPDLSKLTELEKRRVEFWIRFNASVRRRGRHITPKVLRPLGWMGFGVGRTGFGLRASLSTQNPSKNGDGMLVRASLFVNTADAADLVERWRGDRKDIEEEFGGRLVWDVDEGRQEQKIFVTLSKNWQDSDEREKCCRWLAEKLDRLYEVFQPRIQKLPLP